MRSPNEPPFGSRVTFPEARAVDSTSTSRTSSPRGSRFHGRRVRLDLQSPEHLGDKAVVVPLRTIVAPGALEEGQGRRDTLDLNSPSARPRPQRILPSAPRTLSLAKADRSVPDHAGLTERRVKPGTGPPGSS